MAMNKIIKKVIKKTSLMGIKLPWLPVWVCRGLPTPRVFFEIINIRTYANEFPT